MKTLCIGGAIKIIAPYRLPGELRFWRFWKNVSARWGINAVSANDQIIPAFAAVAEANINPVAGITDRRGGPNALARINRTLARLGHEPATGLTISSSVTRKAPIVDIFKSDQLKTTLLVTGAYFALIISFYFLIKWVPKLVVDMGFEPAEAAGILMWLNAGGATGGVIFGVLATRFQLRTLSMIFLVGAAVAISWFGNGATNLGSLAIVVALAGFFTNSAICGMYALFAQVFPITLRSTGTGFALSVGRTGAVLAPVGAGYLFQAGFSLQTVAVIMGLGALLAALLLFFLRGARSRPP